MIIGKRPLMLEKTAKKVIGKTSSYMTENKEKWWWDEEIHRKQQLANKKNNLSYGSEVGREKNRKSIKLM